MHDGRGRLGLAASSAAFMPEHRELRRRAPEVRDPRPHEVEHVAVDAELLVERTDRRDRPSSMWVTKRGNP